MSVNVSDPARTDTNSEYKREKLRVFCAASMAMDLGDFKVFRGAP
jgi:hypothetical protein